MSDTNINISPATVDDLAGINQVIEAAIMQWNLPERVKRLSLPSYFYTELDLEHFEIIVAKQSGKIIGLASWQRADTKDTPAQQDGLLLHGLYILPDMQNQGTGKQLLNATENAARDKGLAGILVKAQPDATGYFCKQGMHDVEIQNASRDYAHRLWKALTE